MWDSIIGFKLFGRRGAPVSQAHQGFQPRQLERAVLFQQAQCPLAPGGALLAQAHLHQRELERGGGAVFAVEIERGQHVAFVDATREAFDVGGNVLALGGHCAQAHAYLAVMSKDQVRDEIGVRFAVVLRQPAEHGGEFMAEETATVAHRPSGIGFRKRRRWIGRQTAAIHGALKHRMKFAEIVPAAGTHYRIAVTYLVDCDAQLIGVLGDMGEVRGKQYRAVLL